MSIESCSQLRMQGPVLKILFFLYMLYVYTCLSYHVASESVIKPCIKNDNPLVD